jgi:hypothetical protein
MAATFFTRPVDAGASDRSRTVRQPVPMEHRVIDVAARIPSPGRRAVDHSDEPGLSQPLCGGHQVGGDQGSHGGTDGDPGCTGERRHRQLARTQRRQRELRDRPGREPGSVDRHADGQRTDRSADAHAERRC